MSAGGGQSLWVDFVIDLFIGCWAVSSGCANCPSCASLRRWGFRPGLLWPNTEAEWGKFYDHKKIRPGSLVMLCSTSDFFIEGSEGWWARAVEGIKARPDVTFLALTKRLGQAHKFIRRLGMLENLWIGFSAETNKELVHRITELNYVPATGYVLSLQPLLEEIDLEPWINSGRFNLVVAGRELGDKSRPCDNAWLDKIESQCEKHHTACFLTRWVDKDGNKVTNKTWPDRGGNRRDRRGYNPKYREAPTVGSLLQKEMQRLRQLKKKAA